MYKKGLILLALLLTLGLISACGSDDNNDNNANNNNEEENVEQDNANNNNNDNNNNNENDDNNNNNANDEEDNTAADEEEAAVGDGEFADLIEYMEDETEGSVKLIYENDESQEHDMEGLSVTLDEYKLVELNDFHTNFKIPFDDQTDGGVIIAKYTVENDTGDDAYYMPSLALSYTGATKVFDNYKELLPEDEQLPEMLSPSNDYLIEAGEDVTGFYTYPLGEDRLEDVMAEGEADIEVPEPHEDKGEVTSNFGKEGQFTISLDQDSAAEASADESQDFYEDKATADNMGDKEMIKSKADIEESEKVGDAEVTLDGYQFTEFEPNKDEAPRFEGFDNGVVLLTVKFGIDNSGDKGISKNAMQSKLTMDNGSKYTLGEGMLLDYRNDDLIEASDSGDLLQVYVLDKEDYDKILKDKSFEVEVGPMRDEEAQDISKGKEAQFDLPE